VARKRPSPIIRRNSGVRIEHRLVWQAHQNRPAPCTTSRRNPSQSAARAAPGTAPERSRGNGSARKTPMKPCGDLLRLMCGTPD
jgi:hypothetical protein